MAKFGSVTQKITAAPRALVASQRAKQMIAKMRATPSPLDGKRFLRAGGA